MIAISRLSTREEQQPNIQLYSTLFVEQSMADKTTSINNHNLLHKRLHLTKE